MHDRLDDLFILDAEQAAKELLIYGEGRSDQPIDRLSGTTAYLAPLLQSCGLLRHADACLLFTELFEVADEGQIRRLIREFAELTIHALEALKAGATISELGDDEALEQLFSRLRPYSTNPGQSQRAPTPSRFRQLDSSHTDPDRELIANAFRAIEAVDSLAVMIAQEAKGQGAPIMATQMVSELENRSGEHAAMSMVAVVKPSTEDSSAAEDTTLAAAMSPEDNKALAETIALDEDDVAQVSDHETDSVVDLDTEQGVGPWALPDGLNEAADGRITKSLDVSDLPDALEIRSPPVDLSSLAIASMDKSASSPQWAEPPGQKLQDFGCRSVVTSVQIDAAFRKALRLSQDGPWAQGMATLLESIDVLDHVSLREALPQELTLLGGNEILVQPELARMLRDECHQAKVSGVGDAMLVSQTLILAIQHDRLVFADRLAKQIAAQGGRIEVDTALKRWRIVVPASARLLRITQLQVDGVWLAVPWAQFLGLEGRVPRQEAQLCIGNESDRMRVEALGLVSTGVRFDLPRSLRRRERYRGLVMLANADCLPVYA